MYLSYISNVPQRQLFHQWCLVLEMSMCSVMFCLPVYVLSHVMCDSGSIIIGVMLGSNNVLSDVL